MRKLLIIALFFFLGIFSVLRFQHYNRFKTEEDSLSESLKNVIDGVVHDYKFIQTKCQSLIEEYWPQREEKVKEFEPQGS